MHLANGQSVTVSARGFAPNQPVFIAECNMNLAADGEAACDLSTYLTVTTTVKGRVPPTPFTVLTGAIGNGTCGTSKADRNCYIAVTNEALTSFANVQIVFAAP